MKERPILFSGPMVRAILDGAKTQTRRLVKAGDWAMDELPSGQPWPYWRHHVTDGESVPVACPYGEPGDRLWVRETWGLHGRGDYTWWCRDSIKGRTADDLALSYELAYAADATSEYDHWRPSIHMPRWASRITLEVTSVRVERLQDITEADAIAEGVEREPNPLRWRDYERNLSYPNARDSFMSLWRSINGPESWAANSWVWVVGFRRIAVGSAP